MGRTAHAVRAAFGSAAFVLGIIAQSTASAAVGRTVGEADVSPTGEAQYSVPVFTPPGANKLTPDLSFEYGHRRGDGLLGTGWEISGLSVISRCNKTYAQDGVSSAPVRATSDAYCWNGQRLRLTSGIYGAANSTYQTEIETFARIKALAGTGVSFPVKATVQN